MGHPKQQKLPKQKRRCVLAGGEGVGGAGGGVGIGDAAPRWGGRAAASFNAETFDFLIESGERDLEALRRFGLIPVGALEHVANNATLHFFHDFEKGVRG